MGTAAPVPVFGAQGQPAQLIPVSDGNFADLASQLKPGQQLRGRVAEILADGKAVVNFRGIFVTAALKGVELARGEVISVMVRNLGNDPTFQMIRPAKVPAASATPVRLDRATEAILRDLGLPRDEFHGTLIRLMQDYGITPAREAVAAIKDIIARLPFQLDLPAPAASAQGTVATQPASPAPLTLSAGAVVSPAPEGPQLQAREAPQPGANPASQEPLMNQSQSQPLPVANLPDPLAAEAAGAGARPAVISGRAVETAIFLYSSGLPPHGEVARAAFDFLFAEPRLPAALGSFEQKAEALRSAPLPAALSEGLSRALAASRRVTVNPERGQVPEQLRSLAENLGLGYEARLARAAEIGRRGADRGEEANPRPEAARGADTGLEPARETLKGALLELQARIERSDLSGLSATVRESVESLGRTGGELLRAIQAQQVGTFVAQDATSSIWLQIPLVPGAELRGGEIQVSWKRDREGRKRDARAPAQMTMRLDTRALGPVNVSMRLLGPSLAVVIGVRDGTVRDFVAGELPALVERLTGGAVRVDRCVCELVELEDERPARPVAPTSSLDLRA